MNFVAFLDNIHSQVSRHPFLKRFTLLNRLLLAVAFIPTGLVKMKYERFSQISTDNQIGFFFEAFYQNELWYMAVGFSQILAGLLLLIPRTAHLGAFLFLPIIVNINLITFGAGFSGTPVVTGLMLLSNLYLVLWEYPHWRSWLNTEKNMLSYTNIFFAGEGLSYLLGAIGLMCFFLGTRGLVPLWIMQAGLYMVFGAALMWMIVMLYHLYRSKKS